MHASNDAGEEDFCYAGWQLVKEERLAEEDMDENSKDRSK